MANICEIQRSDINRDGTVDIDDMIILGQAHGSRPDDATWNPRADINQDGVVDDMDLEMLQNDFGRACPVPSIIPSYAMVGFVGLVILYILTR